MARVESTGHNLDASRRVTAWLAEGDRLLADANDGDLTPLMAAAFRVYTLAVIKSAGGPDSEVLCAPEEAARRLSVSVKTLRRRRSIYDFIIQNPSGRGFKCHVGKLREYIKKLRR